MADSDRLQVLKAFTSLFETIATADGYNNDLDGLVFRGRAVYGENDPKTLLSILESPRSDQPFYAGENDSARNEQWPLLVQGWCPDDKVNPSDPLYGLLDDCMKALDRVIAVQGDSGYPKYEEHYMLGGLITSLRFGPGVVRPPVPSVSAYAFMYLPMYVGLARVSS